MEDIKICTKCGYKKPTSKFYEQKFNRFIINGKEKWVGSRYSARCKKCISDDGRERRQKNKKLGSPQKKSLVRKGRYIEYKKRWIKEQRYVKHGLNYVFNSPINNLRKCTKCKEYMSKENFTKTNNNKAGYYIQCKKCINKKRRKRYRKKHPKPPPFNVKIYFFMDTIKKGDGSCLYCGETNFWMLNNHHPWKKHDPNFIITLCENHHALFTRGRRFLLQDWL